MANIFRRTASSSSSPPRRRNYLASIRAKGLSPSAPTPTSSSSTPITKKSSAQKPITCAWTIPCSRASRSKARPKRFSPAAAQSLIQANSSAAPAPANSSAATRTPGCDSYSFVEAGLQPRSGVDNAVGAEDAVHWKIAPQRKFMTARLPSLVIVGRPNVGKSTLFNRLTGTRRSIVTNEPGITRDRIYGKAEWRGKTLEVVDTGGIIPDEKALIPQEILRQAQVAIKEAALLVLVVDSQAGLTPLDEELARLMRTTGKPFVLAVNKVDSPSQEANAAPFHSLGVPVFPITAEHGTGVDDLLDHALAHVFAEQQEVPGAQHAAPLQRKEAQAPVVGAELPLVELPIETAPIEVAIIGRPNVGKSTLLNCLVGEERSIVSPIPGTTMDNVDTEIARGGRNYRIVDTAGIRRKGKTTLVAEKLSVVMARRGLDRCDVALLVIDGEQGVTQGDATIAGYAEQSGRSLILLVNNC